MAEAEKQARKEALRAQARFERAQGRLEDAGDARRKSFKQAADTGLSMAEIADAVGLHRTRVNQIINGK
jgi:DNA-directed RNA polymerase specialized sigma24 family protein